jgi:hypothetical protein
MMDWIKLYTADKQPTEAEIADYIASPLWKELNDFLRENYEVEPKLTYSTCSGQPGWNVKYQKAGRSLCTLYPMEGFFIALVVIGTREEMEAEPILLTCDEGIQTMYNKAVPLMGGRWLMIQVTSDKILDDVKQLIQLRRKIKRRA